MKGLKAARVRAGMNQKELSERIGVTPTTISAWEIGRNGPNRENVQKLCRVLQCRESDLWGDEDRPKVRVSIRCHYKEGNHTQHYQDLRWDEIPKWLAYYRYTHPTVDAFSVCVALKAEGVEP